MTGMLELAARVEAATGPCRELDEAITLAVGWPLEVDDPIGIIDVVRPLTASLDAALTLVPEGWCFTVADYWCEGDAKPPYFADCGDLTALKAGVDGRIEQAWAQTPALALCAAALRSIASMREAKK